MVGTYKTPGVYIEEISKFPPSIAPVETAIPAFIGYTEKAERKGESLQNKPTRIESIAEYEELFGGEPSQQVTLYLDANNQFVRAEATPTLFLYNSLRLFYANGGGNCYIVSVGFYDDLKSGNKPSSELLINEGLKALREADEPTIIIAPDALSTEIGPYEFQKQALKQCNDLQDRVTLCDLENATNKNDFGMVAQKFKDGIGMSYLKYGAAYGPWIKANFRHTILHRNLTLVQDNGGRNPPTVNLETLTTDDSTKNFIAVLKAAENFVNKTEISLNDGTNVKELESRLKTLLTEYENAVNPTTTAISTYTDEIINRIKSADIYEAIDQYADQYPNLDENTPNPLKLKADIDAYAKASSSLEKMLDVSKSVFKELKDGNKTAVNNARTVLITAKSTLIATSDTLEKEKERLLNEYKNLNSTTASRDDVQEKLQDISKFMLAIVQKIKGLYDATTLSQLKKTIEDEESAVKTTLKTLAEHHNHLKTLPNADIFHPLDLNGTALNDVAGFLGFTDGNTLLTSNPASSSVSKQYEGKNTNKARGDVVVTIVEEGVNAAIKFFNNLEGILDRDLFILFTETSWDTNKERAISRANKAIALFRFIETTQNHYEQELNKSLLAEFGTYKNLVSTAADALNILPPSGAIAGVYAAVDRERGVWKAPANVSLNAIKEPVFKISHEQQGEYNVDANTGKSINIIRSFTGKGVLVWGARTLAGNDNEWRYISVRRFFNFVEESVKKATEQFVFEPNDANTWVKIQAMIENFLTTLWRQGALQGIKPEHAFYVAVGLGKTMTALDILEGRMIIEIGMAAVRPAEFIILRFSHKMPES